MDDVFAEMEADALDATAIPSDEKLAGVAGLAQEMLDLEKRIEETSAYLTELKHSLNSIQTGKLPEALAEIGLTGLPLDNGFTVEVKPFVSASITAKNRDKAHKWLNVNGHADLIKSIVSVNVGKDSEAAENAWNALVGIGLEPSSDAKVHPQTLKVFVREQVEKGAPIPLELFGAYLGQKATIKRK